MKSLHFWPPWKKTFRRPFLPSYTYGVRTQVQAKVIFHVRGHSAHAVPACTDCQQLLAGRHLYLGSGRSRQTVQGAHSARQRFAQSVLVLGPGRGRGHGSNARALCFPLREVAGQEQRRQKDFQVCSFARRVSANLYTPIQWFPNCGARATASGTPRPSKWYARPFCSSTQK